jgi:putative transposase
MARGNNKNVIFKNDADYSYFLQLITRFKAHHDFDLFHFCLMPTHIHFLVQTKKAQDFSIFMKKLNLAYFHHFRQSYGWVGHFWQDRFKSQAVGKDEYFIQCGKYIELNPVRKGLTDLPENYRWSSYRHYTLGEKNQLVTDDFVYLDIGKSNEKRRRYYADLVVEEAVFSSYGANVWGSPSQQYNEKKKQQYHSER